MKLAHAALLAGLCTACGTSTDTSTSTTTGGGARGTTSVGRTSAGGATSAGDTTTGGSSSSSSGSGSTGTATSGTTTFGPVGGSAGSSNSSSTTGGAGSAGSSNSSSTTGGAGTAGSSSSSTTGGPTTYKLRVQVLGGKPGSVTLQNDHAETLTFTGDGNQVFAADYAANANYAISDLTATHAHRACTWKADAPKFGSADVNVTVSCVWQAVRVLGQADFSGHESNQATGAPPGPNTMQNPTGNPVVGGNNVLFISDASNNRILGYTSAPSASNANANFQLGQASFTGSNPASEAMANGFHLPSAVASNGTRFAVADTDNDRVLLYSTQPQQTGNANFALKGARDCNMAGLYRMTGVAWAGDKLIVADTTNARVLIYNAVPTDPNQTADVILGQPGANSGQNYCTSHYPVTASSIYGPASVFSDGTRLVVTDTGESRVMIWNSIPTQTNQPADVIVGQADNGSQSQGSGAAGMTRPQAAIIQGGRLFVADSTNNRVLYWNTVPTTTGVAADGVLGWASPTASSVTCAGASSSTLCTPTGVAVYGGYIFVVDTDNHRVLMFADDLT